MRRFLMLLVATAIVLAGVALSSVAFAQSRNAKVATQIDITKFAPSYESEDFDGQPGPVSLSFSHHEGEDAEH